MLDPITSLLATCVNCNQLSSTDDRTVIPTPCNVEQRSNRSEAQHNTLQHNTLQHTTSTACISPPETTLESLPESLNLGSRAIEAWVSSNPGQTGIQHHVTQPQPTSPESVMLVSWSSSTASPQTRPAASSTAKPAASNLGHQVLQLGTRGQPVAQLQTRLKQLGHYAGAVDGIYGRQTQAAVVQFQRSKKLQADGVVGSKTWIALQAGSRQPQSETPLAQSSQSPRSKQANTLGDRPPIQTVSAPAQLVQPALVTDASQPQLTHSIETLPQSPLTYLWILGWGVIYGSGWFFILKDTVKEMKGFHFVLSTTEKKSKKTNRQMVTHLQRDKKDAPVIVVLSAENKVEESAGDDSGNNIKRNNQNNIENYIENNAQSGNENNSKSSENSVALPKHRPIESPNQPSIPPQPTQAFLNVANIHDGHLKNAASSHSSHHATHPDKVETFALQDPWQQENEALSIQVLDVVLADGGQVQPIQNVFVVAPRPTVNNRRRVKKVAPIIYDVKAMRQKVKTG